MLGARTEVVGRSQRPDDPARRYADRPGHPRDAQPRRHRLRDQADAEQGGLPVGVRRRARNRRPSPARRCMRSTCKPVAVTLDETLPVKISAPDLCGRFSGRVIRGVNARAKSPHWMVERLERSGQRSISALVDISNYVMLELGRPSHVFDLDKIHGGIEVRWGRKGETLKLLNGNTVELDETVGVIADEQHVESLAGIMGGDSTAVIARHDQHLSRSRVLVARQHSWPLAQVQLLDRRGASLRARRRLCDDRRAHRAHHAIDPRYLRRRSRSGRRSDRQRADSARR